MVLDCLLMELFNASKVVGKGDKKSVKATEGMIIILALISCKDVDLLSCYKQVIELARRCCNVSVCVLKILRFLKIGEV